MANSLIKYNTRIQHSTFSIQHFLLLFFMLPLLIFGQEGYRKVKNETFQRGEFIEYKAYYDSWITYWMTAGIGTMEIAPEPVFLDGRETYHITVHANSAGLFNVFYKVRDRYESFVDIEGLMPLKFIRYTREGSYEKDDEVLFDHQGKTAKSTRKTKKIPPFVHDIVSSYYYMRTWDFDTAVANDKYYLDFYLDDSLFHSEIIFLGREKLKTDFGELDCLKFKPQVAVGEVFKDPYSMELWVTDDKNKIPVLLRSAVFVGSVKIELVDFRGLKWPLGTK